MLLGNDHALVFRHETSSHLEVIDQVHDCFERRDSTSQDDEGCYGDQGCRNDPR